MSSGTYRGRSPIGTILLLFLFLFCAPGLFSVASAASQQRDGMKSGPQCSMWQVMKNPTSARASSNGLLAVVAITTKDVWAVGAASGMDENGILHHTPLQAMIQHWNGVSWQEMPSPMLANVSSVALTSVAAHSAQDIWAAGYSTGMDMTTTRQLIEHWDGKVWRTQTLPPLHNTTASSLAGIVLLSPKDIWAAGNYTPVQAHTTSSQHVLIQHWNGTTWQRIVEPTPPPLAGLVSERVEGIAAPSSRDIWIVGSIRTSNGGSHPLIEHWNGKVWSAIDPPVPSLTPKSVSSLHAVAALSANNIWAVGHAQDAGHGPTRSLIMHWNGTRWQDVPGPASADGGDLQGITALSANNIWAVGSFSNDTRIEHWNGTRWSTVAAPSFADTDGSVLSGITHEGRTQQLWAVGSTNQQALTEWCCQKC